MTRGLTLKAWFVSEAEALVRRGQQPELFAAEPDGPPYAAADTHERRSR